MSKIIYCYPAGNLTAIEQVAFDKLSNLFDELSPTSNLGKEEKGIHVFPNPTSDILFLEIENFKRQHYYIFNISGKKIKTGEVNSAKESIFIDELNAGLYFIQVGQTVKKFVKH